MKKEQSCKNTHLKNILAPEIARVVGGIGIGTIFSIQGRFTTADGSGISYRESCIAPDHDACEKLCWRKTASNADSCVGFKFEERNTNSLILPHIEDMDRPVFIPSSGSHLGL